MNNNECKFNKIENFLDDLILIYDDDDKTYVKIKEYFLEIRKDYPTIVFDYLNEKEGKFQILIEKKDQQGLIYFLKGLEQINHKYEDDIRSALLAEIIPTTSKKITVCFTISYRLRAI